MKSTSLLLIVIALALWPCACSGPGVNVSPGRTGYDATLDAAIPVGRPLVVDGSLLVQPGEYFRPALGQDGEAGVIVLEGMRDIELDLSQVVLRGAPADSPPDRGAGFGLVIRNCEGLRVKGGRFSGYRVAIWVDNSDEVTIEGAVFDPVFGNRLAGTSALPNSYDRLQIEMDEPQNWIELYGAAIAVVDSSRVEVRGCRARGGQNGLIALRSEGCRFLSNDFSYLSGWGIALAYSDRNLIADNRCDAVTRHGTGGRTEPDHGATGILLTGGSSENTICSNSARRCSAGGREIFGGQASGAGNRWYANDFSRAECVSMELDRSRDTWFMRNRLLSSEGTGLRARSTEGVAILGNRIELMHGAGISLEDASRSLVSENDLIDCDLGLEIRAARFGDPSVDRGHWISGNRFSENIQDIVLDRSAGLVFQGNDFESASARAHLDGLTGAGERELSAREVWHWLEDSQGHLPSGRSLGSSLRRPSQEPPKILEKIAAWSPPPTRADLPANADREARMFEVETLMGEFGPWDPAGNAPRPGAGKARGLLAGVRWAATWFAWTAESDPRGDLERWRSRRFEPLQRASVEAWYDPFGGSEAARANVPATHFGLIATAEIHVDEAGTYLLSEISDDGLRVTIDDEVILEDWTWHPERQSSRKIELSSGSHRVSLEYFQIDGAAALSLELGAPPGR